MIRQPPHGFKGHPAWEAFDLWADAHTVGTDVEDWEPFWDCFYAGFEIGLAEAA